MAELPTSKNIGQKYLDARKAQQGVVSPKKVEDDDDSSGGGSGKRMQSSYKLEKLLGVLEKGRVKAQNFWRFLGKEGLDSHETKKSTLGKQTEEATKVTEKVEKAEINKNSEERAEEVKEAKQANTITDKSESAWQKAKAADDSAQSVKQRFGFQDSSPFSIGASSVAETTRRNIMGNRTAGSIIGAMTNPLGFAKQVDITGDAAKSTAKASAQQAMFQAKTERAAARSSDTVASIQQTNKSSSR